MLVKEKAELEALLTELGSELQQAKADLGEEKKSSRDLVVELEVSSDFKIASQCFTISYLVVTGLYLVVIKL